ncbi:MAG: MFS transporter, partial [Candidatus Gracilibacteria bacterium]|nr:MFS transporter [Candidatus Gracilibacteria bacterium]
MNKKLYIPLIIIFLDILGFSFILPSIPFIIEKFGGDSTFVGITISLTALGMFFGSIVFGKLSDKFGRKFILLVSIISNIIGYILFGISSNLFIFIFARFLNGFGGGGMSVLQAYIGDISEENEKITNLGYVGASIGLGFLLGPIIGYFLIGYNLNFIGFFSSILLSIALFICLFFFKNSDKQIVNNTKMKLSLKFEKIFFLFFISFSVTLTLIGIQTILPFFLKDTFNLGIRNIYLIFGYVGIIAVLYQILGLKIIKLFFKDVNILKIGLFTIFLSL